MFVYTRVLRLCSVFAQGEAISLYPTPVTVSIFTELASSFLRRYAAQVRDMHIDRTRLTVEVEAPGFLQDLLAAEDESAVFSEGEEQVKFLRAQVYSLC